MAQHAIICELGEGDDIRLTSLIEGEALDAIREARKIAYGYRNDMLRDGHFLAEPKECLYIPSHGSEHYEFGIGYPDDGIRWIVHKFI